MDRGLNISLAVGQGVKMMARVETPSEKIGNNNFICLPPCDEQPASG